MIPQYKLNTGSQLDLGWRDVEFWLSIFPKLTQADIDNPNLFIPNLESMVEPKDKEQEWDDIKKRQIYNQVCNTLSLAPVMVELREDGVYTRIAGSESNGKAFTIYWANSYPFPKQQPPQKQQKEKNEFVWTREHIEEFILAECNKHSTWDIEGLRKYMDTFKASKSNPVFNPKALKPGVYRLEWIDGGKSLASVGHTADGTPWFAPCHWTTRNNMNVIVASTIWLDVKNAELIEEYVPKI